ncbi:ribonuclease P [Acidianus sulfidivorans JP7]|uniref:Ribonuclease P protein component 2 n=1 Tax=Acidianus sulfidivorans JP7 TaxID=619593 RepID=A0A2U9IMI0_9CREN|nr:Rpp14/Pop5 family protein [Acidianus sulfidivorans]AWR97269.1 ribonuclease P [Acidianus sulfidivorans JP7]
MLQTIIDIFLIIWLAVLTYYTVYKKMNIVKVKTIKNKQDIKSKRYIIFYLITESNSSISRENLELAIRDSLKDFMGKMWLEIANPRVILYLDDTKQGIISTNRVGYKAVLASLPFVKSINNSEILIVPKRTTGSLKRAKKLLNIR